ncbi:MAG: tetratricopeptide repeat protein [Rhodoferax sp.]|nr:tetratricopeptide repeat protein [Rhodoferax sp.]
MKLQSEAQTPRRLAAIAFADIVGWTQLIEHDDAGTAHAWGWLRTQHLEPLARQHGGRVLKLLGDAVVIEFGSTVESVRWAVGFQQRLAELRAKNESALEMRIGVSVEDVLLDDLGDLVGDGVNVAARIQQLASAGEVVLTSAVHDFVVGKLPFTFRDLGLKQLKNRSRSVRLYRIEANPDGPAGSAAAPSRSASGFDSRPTLAVLPFRMDGTGDEDYFGQGMTEEIISALAMNRSLLVMARESTLRYKSRTHTSTEIAAETGVRYLIEGSIRRAAQRLRISANLIDATTGWAIWSRSFDGRLDDLFEFQDEIATSVAATVDPHVQQAEISRVRERPTASLNAYDCLLRGLALLHTFDPADFAAAGGMFQRAIDLDPRYAQAHAHLAWWHNLRIGEARSSSETEDRARAVELARRAVALDPNDALVLSVGGHIESFLNRKYQAALDMFGRALARNPSSAWAWSRSATTLAYLGRGEEALERIRRAKHLSPYDPHEFSFCTTEGTAELVSGRYDRALDALHEARRLSPGCKASLRLFIAAAELAGDTELARQQAAELLALEPAFSVTKFGQWYPLQPPHLERLLGALRRAGLPE